MATQHQKDLAELKEKGHIEHRGFRIYQCFAIERYETNPISGHSWPVYKPLARKWSVDAAGDDLRGLIVSRESTSISDARTAIDIALKFPATFKNGAIVPTEFPISRMEDLVPGQYVRSNLVPVKEGVRPIFLVLDAGVGRCVDKGNALVDLNAAAKMKSVQFFGINPMTLDQSLIRPLEEVRAEVQAQIRAGKKPRASQP